MAVEVAHSQLSIRYDGPAVADGRMDVRQLAPALLGLAEAIQASGRLIEPQAPTVTVSIIATARGSFGIELDLAQASATAGVIFASDPATALANIKALLFDPAIGLVRYLRLRQLQPEVDPNADGSITYQDNERLIVVPQSVVNAGAQVSIRTSLSTVVDPMIVNPGITTCDVVVTPAAAPLTLTATDASAFELDMPEGSPFTDDTYTAQLQIVSLSWDPALSWRFDEGGRRFPARITDPSFYGTHSLDSYRNGDRLTGRVRRRQWDRNGNLSTQYDVIEVLEHRKAPPPDEQLRIGDITDDT